MQIPFEKYEQGGNDFVIVDARSSLLPENLSAWSRKVCDRHKGVGADGLLLLFASSKADYHLRILNADGSEPAMCGNGVSCILTSFFSSRPDQKECILEMMQTVVKGRKTEEGIEWSLGKVQVLHFPIEIPELVVFPKSPLGTWYVVDTGVPHAVCFVTEEPDVERVGRAIRYHPLFSPQGVNVNFARMKGDCIEVRTYERGVEKETLSCGTGGAAVAFVARKLYKLQGPIVVANRLDFCSNPIQYQKQNVFSFTEEEVRMRACGRKIFTGVMFL